MSAHRVTPDEPATRRLGPEQVGGSFGHPPHGCWWGNDSSASRWQRLEQGRETSEAPSEADSSWYSRFRAQSTIGRAWEASMRYVMLGHGVLNVDPSVTSPDMEWVAVPI